MLKTNENNLSKILLVDDDEKQLDALEKLMSKLDVSIIKANSGQQALSLLLRHEFILMLLDIKMPHMNGLEVSQLMRENDKFKNIPIIFMTSYNQDELDLEQAYQLGAIDFLFKPINKDMLINKVESYRRSLEMETTYKNLVHQLEEKNLQLQRSQLAALNMMEDANEAKTALVEQQQQLKETNNELKQFAYVASHDLQEPLNTITSFANLLNKQYVDQLDERSKKYLSHMQKSSVRMREQITSLLEFSQVGQTKKKEKVDCNKIIKEVLEDLHAVIIDSKAKIEIDELPTIHGHAMELQQLFQNLLSNAIKYRKKNQNPEVSLKVKKEEQSWKFSIKDNGIGIDDKFKEKVFVIFQRLHMPNEYKGTGIGLALCKKIAELHGGKIWFESKFGEGSTFHFTIVDKQD